VFGRNPQPDALEGVGQMNIDVINVMVVGAMIVCVIVLALLIQRILRTPKTQNVNPFGEVYGALKDVKEFRARLRSARARGVDSAQAAEEIKHDMNRQAIESLARRTDVPVAVLLVFQKGYPGYAMTPSAIEADASGPRYEVMGETTDDDYRVSDVVVRRYRADGTIVDVKAVTTGLVDLSPEQLPPLIRNSAETAVARGRITFAHGPTPDSP
jgi:hypothetical protein